MFDAAIFPSGNSSIELNRTAKGGYTWSMKVYFAKADKYNLELVIKRVVGCKNLLEQLLGQTVEVEAVTPEEVDAPGIAPPGFRPVWPQDVFKPPYGGAVHGEHPPQTIFEMFDQVLQKSELIDGIFQMWEDIKDIGEYLPMLKQKVQAEKAKADAEAAEKKDAGAKKRRKQPPPPPPVEPPEENT